MNIDMITMTNPVKVELIDGQEIKQLIIYHNFHMTGRDMRHGVRHYCLRLNIKIGGKNKW